MQMLILKFQTIALNKNGHILLKYLILKTKNEPEYQEPIVSCIESQLFVYVQDENGNFVVSEVVNTYSFEVC